MTTTFTYRDILDVSTLLERLDPGVHACTVDECVHHSPPPAVEVR